LLKFQPAFNLYLITLRTGAVFTGVVPHSLHMPSRTGLNMTAYGPRAALDNVSCNEGNRYAVA
jgi:hypothetical protein